MVCRPLVEAMLTLTTSKQPLLELRGARGLGRIAFKAPFYCPNANRTLLETKAEIAQAGGVPALIGTLCFCLPFLTICPPVCLPHHFLSVCLSACLPASMAMVVMKAHSDK